MRDWINARAIGECAYCGGEIYEGCEFYASGFNTLACSKECRDAYIAEHESEIGEDDFVYWEEYEYEIHR
jgi:hypothetical protein